MKITQDDIGKEYFIFHKEKSVCLVDIYRGTLIGIKLCPLGLSYLFSTPRGEKEFLSKDLGTVVFEDSQSAYETAVEYVKNMTKTIIDTHKHGESLMLFQLQKTFKSFNK